MLIQEVSLVPLISEALKARYLLVVCACYKGAKRINMNMRLRSLLNALFLLPGSLLR